MSAHDFTIWLRGFLAGLKTRAPEPEDWQQIEAMLREVKQIVGVQHGTPMYPPGARSLDKTPWHAYATANPLEPTL